jgi:outer membrane protein assembly factor BamB
LNSHRDQLLHLTLDEFRFYAQASSGIVTAFDAETGKRLWAAQVGGSDRATYPLTFNDELLFVVNGMKLFAVQKIDGNIRWDLTLPAQPTTSPVSDELRVYMGFMDGSCYAFDLEMIDELNATGLLSQWSGNAIAWRYKTSKSIVVPVVPAGDIVAFASQNGSLYSVTASDRKLNFQFETDARLSAPMGQYKNQLLIASEDYNFYAVDIRSGATSWQMTAGLPIRRQPQVILGQAYLSPERGGMYKIATETGRIQWHHPRAEELVAVTPRRVYATDELNNLLILSRETGANLGMIPLPKFTRRVNNDRTDRIYLATSSGLILGMHETNRDFPVFHRYPDRLPLLPEFGSENAKPVEPPPPSSDDAAGSDSDGQ